MTRSDDAEALRHLNVPQPSMGAPLPAVVASEHRLSACYYLDQPAGTWRPEGFTGSPPPADHQLARLRVEGCRIHKFGPPDENTVFGHRLAPLGLAEGWAFEVLNSAWIAELRRLASVAAGHAPTSYDGVRHFIFVFHDSTLEFVARDLEVTTTPDDRDEILRGFVDEL